MILLKGVFSTLIPLKIDDGIGIGFCQVARYARTSLFDDLFENLGGKLFALIMANNTNLYLLVVTKELMIMHFARYESVGTGFDGFGQKERSGTATDGHFADWTS